MRNILTAFLASPGDLQEERNIVRESVERLNKVIGRELNWQIELLGWEDTLPGYARPQSIINRDVEACELFLGILWRRWGQPTGEYESGFEEEFVRASSRHNTDGKPEIWLFFKEVDIENIKDPGEQLSKVLKFKEEQIREKKVFFKEFCTSGIWGNYIYDLLLTYVLRLSNKLPETPVTESNVAPTRTKEDTPIEDAKSLTIFRSLPTDIEILFSNLNKDVINSGPDALDFWKRTRLFLFASALFSDSHIGETFGAHEINLAYRKRKEWALSKAEFQFLVRSIVNDGYDVKPGWYWLKNIPEETVDQIYVSLAINDQNAAVRAKAFSLLASIRYDAPRELIENGLSDSNDDIVLQTINLLNRSGKIEYIGLLEPIIIKEVTKLRDVAMTTKFELLYKINPDDSFKYLIENRVKLPPSLEMHIGDVSLGVSDEVLFDAITKAETSVRRFVAQYLHKANMLKPDICRQLLNDSDSIIRKQGIIGLIELGESVDIDMIKKLFPKEKTAGQGLLSIAFGDISADDIIPALFRKYEPSKLLLYIDFYDTYVDLAYRVLAEDHYEFIECRIRVDLEDEFKTLIISSGDNLKNKYGPAYENIIKLYGDDLKEFIKAKLISAALAGLVKNGNAEDIKYARKYFQNTRHNMADKEAIELLAKYGDATDVKKLTDFVLNSYGEVKILAIKAALNISRYSIDLLSQYVVSNDKEISKLAAKVLDSMKTPDVIGLTRKMIESENDDVRINGLAILIKRSVDAELEEYIDSYISQDRYYYNIVGMLDRCLFAPGRYKSMYRKRLFDKLSE